jgi:cAMP-dependent protein kinase regulator
VEKEGLLWVMDQKVYNTVNVTHMEEMEKRKAQLVDSVPIFQWLQKSMRQQLVDAMVPQEFRAGQIIMQKGEVGDVFYILDKGEVAVSDGDVQLVTLCGASQ